VPRREWRDRVEDIIDAVERIHEDTESMDFETFSKDRKTVESATWKSSVRPRNTLLRRSVARDASHAESHFSCVLHG
jgi:hypothetical protein